MIIRYSVNRATQSSQKQKIKRDGKMDKCWNWKRSTDTNGYGRVWINGRFKSAPQVAWQLFNGGSLYGKHVLHKCDNRKCFNPKHLFLGSHAENMQDMVAKGRAAKPLAKLTWDEVQNIRFLHTQGHTKMFLAKSYSVDYSQISRIVNNKTWKEKSKNENKIRREN